MRGTVSSFRVTRPDLAALWLRGVEGLTKPTIMRSFNPMKMGTGDFIAFRLSDLPCLDFQGDSIAIDGLEDPLAWLPASIFPPVHECEVLSGWRILPYSHPSDPDAVSFLAGGATGLANHARWTDLRSRGWLTVHELLASLGIDENLLAAPRLAAVLPRTTETFDPKLRSLAALFRPVTMEQLAENGLLMDVLEAACSRSIELVTRCLVSDTARAAAVSRMIQKISP